MDINKVKKLIELLEDSTLNELEIESGDSVIRLSKGSAVVSHALPAPPPPVAPTITAPVATTPTADTAETVSSPTPEGHHVKSPMVGMFYRSPSPGAPSFTEVGKTVKKGDVLCIIEAMKMMNQIEADKDGVVERILVDNGQAVEFEQPLFVIK